MRVMLFTGAIIEQQGLAHVCAYSTAYTSQPVKADPAWQQQHDLRLVITWLENMQPLL